MNTPHEFLFVPLVLQTLLMVVDEFYFHQKRGLPKWERIGHPLDTITVIAPLLYSLLVKFSGQTAIVYIGLALFSCIFIVKDEIIHKDICSRMEMILHGLLFVLHPLVFLGTYIFWQRGGVELFGQRLDFSIIIFIQLIMTTSFLIYQVLYWGIIYGSIHKQRNI